MVNKITKKIDKKNIGWTDVTIESNGKKLSLSVKDGKVLIFSHDSNMDVEFTAGEHYFVKIQSTDEKGRINKMNFSSKLLEV